jgi:NAD-specific glutamate dehydrogenase
MTAQSRVQKTLVEALRSALITNALPGETDGFGPASQADAARFIASTAATRPAGTTAIEIESTGGEAGRRRMRLAVVNEDMPFLVDSIAGAIAARGLTIHRLLHPIVRATRDSKGNLQSLDGGEPESIVYVEVDRADARGRQELVRELCAVLADVRAAVRDWQPMLAEMKADAESLKASDAEAAALLDWFADNNFTLLGHADVDSTGRISNPLGILRHDVALWREDAARAAIAYLSDNGRSVLMVKADRISPVHRRVPLDVVMVRRADGKFSLHTGLWTSAALRTSAEKVPVLRGQLARLDKELGFAKSSHGAKALAHAISTLPHDLLISFDQKEVRSAAMTAMSLADRPRPTLLLLPGVLRRHLYVFVWLPRDELTTARRHAIAAMLENEIGSSISSWSLELGEGELALIRFTMPVDPSAEAPDAEGLDAALVDMVKGWAPAAEAELIQAAGASRATRLALTYIPATPEGYRARTSPEQGAADILRLAALKDDSDRSVRLSRFDTDGPCELHLKSYRRGGLIPLSEAVPVLENFGFKVIEEIPTPLGGGDIAYIHDFRLELPCETDFDGVMARSAQIEDAIACVLSGASEDDEFNQLVLFAGLDTGPVVWLRAWFRYLRQTGSSFGLVTVVDALRRAPDATRALIEMFSAAHDPARGKGREGAVAAAGQAFDEALANVRSIDDDRILRRLRALVEATLRTNAFSQAPDEALAFKIDSARVPGLPAPVPWREIWVYSPRVEGIHLRGGPVARGGLRWSDRRDDFRTEILGLLKAQVVKNAVIVPTGAKGGFYPKMLPPPSNRDAWMAEGTESSRIFIRSLLSKAIRLVAAFDHRHIFIDPSPDPAKSWTERKRLFDLPRSSWDDYDRKLISKGGGVFARTEKSIPLSAEAREALGIDAKTLDPTSLINAILKSPVDLLWFGGIGTYIKSSAQSNADVGDPSNDALRANGGEIRARVIGEGANLGVTQAGRIEFAERGGRINTDFIDNSAGVDCSDNEVNIKIPLNREMREGRLAFDKRNALLAKMTHDVAELVLEDNRLQTLALSIAEAGGAQALPGHVRTIELLETSGKLDRKVEGLGTSDELLRRAQENRGLTRPELAVVLSISKIVLQSAAEELHLSADPVVEPQLFDAFPKPMRKANAEAIRAHRLRDVILATKVANRLVNRLGPGVPYELTEEEGASLQQVVSAFLVAERLLDLDKLWLEIEHDELPETVRIELFSIAAASVRSHLSDIIRSGAGETSVDKLCTLLEPGTRKIAAAATKLIRSEVRNEAVARRDRLIALGASEHIVKMLVRLYELDGVFGIAALATRHKLDELEVTRAYTRLGESLGLDWAQQQVARYVPSDQWERLLTAGLARDFEQLRIEFLSRCRGSDIDRGVEEWIEQQKPRIDQFRELVARARGEAHVSAPMLAQIAGQARILLGR